MTDLKVEEVTMSERSRELITNLIAINRYALDNEKNTYSVSYFINENLVKGYKEKKAVVPVGFKVNPRGELEAVMNLKAEYDAAVHAKQSAGNFLVTLKEESGDQIINLLDISSFPRAIASKNIETVVVNDIREIAPETACKYTELISQMAKAYKLLPIKIGTMLYIGYYMSDTFEYKKIDVFSNDSITETLFDAIKELRADENTSEAINDFACSTFSIINILNTKNIYNPQHEVASPVLYL